MLSEPMTVGYKVFSAYACRTRSPVLPRNAFVPGWKAAIFMVSR